MTDNALNTAFQQALRELDESRAIERMHARDGALWSDDPAVMRKVVHRLGWLTCVPQMTEELRRLVDTARIAERQGYEQALVVGMGGSSLWPEVVGRHLAGRRGLAVRVADSVHPRAIQEALQWSEQRKTLFVIATKSGGTIETISLYRVLRARFDNGAHFIAITDPGSGLEVLARDEGFRAVFLNPSDIGGRFSAGSLFGLVPAALSGVVIKDALARIDDMIQACRQTPARDNPGAELAAWMVAGQRIGRWHLRLAFGKDVRSFAAWVEQLIAESTGKLGHGILPVPGSFNAERADATEALAHSIVVTLSTFDAPDDLFAAQAEQQGVPTRSFVMPEAADLWAEIIRWEVATALAGKLLGINPFDEPDVSSAKAATAGILDGSRAPATPDRSREARKLADLKGMLKEELATLEADDYLAVLLYIAPVGPDRQRALGLREALQDRAAGAITVQFGPRYLHSTGQLHKGGPAKGRFVVVHDLDDIEEGGADDVAIPGGELTARKLLRAQMLGDIAVLKERGKPVELIALT